jgi:ribosomal protein S18 acetylase RimI-like enzyme
MAGSDVATVRVAELDDAEIVGRLTERVYRDGGWTNDAYSKLLLDARHRIETATVFVGVLGGAIVGTVTVAAPLSPMANICRADEVEVRMLAVEAPARRRGIANLLMDACESYAREAGVTAVVLSTEPDMRSAQQLYQRRGYARDCARDWGYGRIQLLVYRLQL